MLSLKSVKPLSNLIGDLMLIDFVRYMFEGNRTVKLIPPLFNKHKMNAVDGQYNRIKRIMLTK